jgi:hypothetical protein
MVVRLEQKISVIQRKQGFLQMDKDSKVVVAT